MKGTAMQQHTFKDGDQDYVATITGTEVWVHKDAEDRPPFRITPVGTITDEMRPLLIPNTEQSLDSYLNQVRLVRSLIGADAASQELRRQVMEFFGKPPTVRRYEVQGNVMVGLMVIASTTLESEGEPTEDEMREALVKTITVRDLKDAVKDEDYDLESAFVDDVMWTLVN